MDNRSDLTIKAASGAYDVLLENLQEAVHILDVNLNVIYQNSAAEQLTGHGPSEVLGKPCLKNVLLEAENTAIHSCRSQCPVHQVLKDAKVRSLDAYLQHKEGYRFPVHMRIIPIRDQAGAVIAAMETFSEKSPKVVIPQSREVLERMALLDPLTELGNRRYLEMHLNSRLAEMKQFGLSFGALLVDVDNMADINASYGRDIGDRILQMIARTLAKNIRFFEVIGRWTGQDFLVVLLNVDRDKLDLVANKLRLLVEKSVLRVDDDFVKTTVSIGATLAEPKDTLLSLVDRARRLTDHAKWKGKNSICLTLPDK